MELAKDIIYLIFGLIILLVGIFEECGINVIVMGCLLTLTAILMILIYIINKKKENNIL